MFNKIMKIKYVLLIITVLFLQACLPEKAGNKVEILETRIGKQTLYIPKAFFKPGFEGSSGKTSVIEILFPDFTPLIKSKKDMWEKGERTQYLRALINELTTEKSFTEVATGSVDYLDAKELVGNEYGLLHYTQPDGAVKDMYDVWFDKDGNEIVSYLTCSEKILETDVPQCRHRFWTDDFRITMSYDKRLLKEWKEIKNGIVQLINQFQSKPLY